MEKSGLSSEHSGRFLGWGDSRFAREEPEWLSVAARKSQEELGRAVRETGWIGCWNCGVRDDSRFPLGFCASGVD
jgi:hypothetical protein